jgi:hypothetical protein
MDDGVPLRSNRAPRSNRFLTPQECDRTRGRVGQTIGRRELFAEGPWQGIRAVLERQGWQGRQIELLYDQLRQGWPLATAKRNVAMLTGHCPIGSRRDG